MPSSAVKIKLYIPVLSGFKAPVQETAKLYVCERQKYQEKSESEQEMKRKEKVQPGSIPVCSNSVDRFH